MSVRKGSEYIKWYPDAETAQGMFDRFTAFVQQAGGTSGDGHHGFTVTLAEPAGLTPDGKGVRFPVYAGTTLADVDNADTVHRALLSVCDWYGGLLGSAETHGSGAAIHGDLHLSNILADLENGRLVLIDPLMKPAHPGTVWVDLLTLTTSFGLHPSVQKTHIIALHRAIRTRILAAYPDLKRRRLLLRSSVLLMLRFTQNNRPIKAKAAALWALAKSTLLWMRIL